MMKAIRHISCLLLLCFALVAAGCQDDLAPKLPANIQQGEGDVTLSLNVRVGGSAGSGTRADGNPFEVATDKYEMINTLRVIIVRSKDNTVEINRLIEMPPGEAVDKLSNLEFKVSTSLGEIERQPDGYYYRTEHKQVYLVANEASIPKTAATEEGYDIQGLLEGLTPGYYKKVENVTPGPFDPIDTDQKNFEYVPGSKFTPDDAKKLILWNDWDIDPTLTTPKYAVPVVDNDETEEKEYVVMTEFFDFDVTSNVSTGYMTGKQEKNLFITRNFVKFRFSLDAVEGTQPFKVKSIRVGNLMQKEYFFPRCTYSPEKDILNGVTGREITSYTTPPKGAGKNENYIRPFVFEPGDELLYNGAKTYYSPSLYFCETKNYVGDEQNNPLFDITVTLEFDGEIDEDGNVIRVPEEMTFDPVVIPNEANLSLKDGLPRNTIVQVNMILDKKQGLTAAVVLVPYIGVDLKPDFGFDELKPKKDEENEEGE